ncbi:lipopolysaccharide transport periplasmic protein LptA [Thiohalocapsa sp. ML1]|uniref:lipopolysaccharide transport periplasmic protein LptA n=1 Tax=Thiohalocapsa sp. ML1 TaxID=1431688 RepID=UPI0007323A98|nr:lipopolysaccharide transport periplasmic protein LptA [Thiohalocapsa sp. ML1]
MHAERSRGALTASRRVAPSDLMHGGRAKARVAVMLCVIGGLFAPALPALDSDQEQPMFVEADAAEFDEKQSISLYLGNVEVQQGSMRIQADEVLVHHKPNRQPQKIIAIGNPVRYRQRLDNDPDEVRARALRMEYEADPQEITLIDQAELVQGEDRFASDRIVYNRSTERLTAGTSASGRERVKIRIEPQDNTGGQDAGDQ